jgi:hypothetical protein
MTRSSPRRAVVLVAATVALTALVGPAGAAPTPEVKSLQKQVKTLKTQVASLRTQLNSLKASVGEATARAEAAGAAAATAGQTATAAVTKTNCLVTGTALVLWTNDVYVQAPDTLFADTGLSLSAASEPVSVYVAGVNPSCVPSVFPRAGAASFKAFAGGVSEGALLSPH